MFALAMFFGHFRGSSAQTPVAAAPSNDRVASLSFSGPYGADLFTKEIEASFQRVLEKDFVSVPANGEPAGFVNASPAEQPWNGTMWTRDPA
jgi:hypothetical protein